MPTKKTVHTKEYVCFDMNTKIIDEDAVTNDRFTKPQFKFSAREINTKETKPMRIESESEESFVYKMNY